MNQNYLMINKSTNIVDNVCIWDGNTQTWTPPLGYLMLVQSTTPALVWGFVNGEYILVSELGGASVGFTWNGTECITNDPKPATLNPSISSGTQDI